LEARNWKLEIGNWQLEIGNSRMETGKWKLTRLGDVPDESETLRIWKYGMRATWK
jgi:hypothetical protein